MKIFLSYSVKDRAIASQIKDALKAYRLRIFLAHEDIKPTAEWVKIIYKELTSCDVFLPVLTTNFAESVWTDQETGIAYGLDKLIVPLKINIDPHGFIAPYQALKINLKNIGPAITKLLDIFAEHENVGILFRDALIEKYSDSSTYAAAKRNTELLTSYDVYNIDQVEEITRQAISNNQIHDCFDCRDMLRNFIKAYKNQLDQDLLDQFLEVTKRR